MFGLFGCSQNHAIVYRPNPRADVASCAVVEVTEVKMGKPVSPSMVKPDSWFEGKVTDRRGVEGEALHIDFESLTNLQPTVGQSFRVHLNADGDAVRIEAVESGASCEP